jgi:hypothetical protein
VTLARIAVGLLRPDEGTVRLARVLELLEQVALDRSYLEELIDAVPGNRRRTTPAASGTSC